ncbi:putative plant/MSJ11-3 protein [Senna tora]|uniref:Putative plant/MSJ11-3 protein n=1 Tax=Senna tora TaxID=362788 RepID=A0A834SN98_9FABA|nr:putative plant/MSJ11-3 protein [Senna tora]
MASTFTPIRPAVICASSGHRKPDLDRRRSSSSANWWTPMFGFSSEPDYIDSNSSKTPDLPEKSESKSKPSRPRFAGCLTEDKARQLRLMTMEMESFHDTMYHSAIASRLASDFKTRSDQ